MSKIDICGYEFTAAPDEWDRLYGVDFFRQIGDSYIGIQIKPGTFQSSSVYGRLKGALRDQRRKFRKEFGGQVFMVYKDDEGKIINADICEEIRGEIQRLSGTQ